MKEPFFWRVMFPVFFGTIFLMVILAFALQAWVLFKGTDTLLNCENPGIVAKTENGETSYSLACTGK